MTNFWTELPRPFFALAPMYDVTDSAFRSIICHTGKPDVLWTEFVSTDGLCSEIGRARLMHHLKFNPVTEQPIVAQIFGTKPEHFQTTAALLAELGFNGIDINMGCPDKNIIKGGSCAALFRTPELARDLVFATQAGAPNLPVSVKIRIGDTKIDWQNWIQTLLTAEPAAITIHLRTRKEMSKVPAHWELMPKIVQFIREHASKPITIIGNGDIRSLAHGRELAQTTGCDGLMIGRAIFQNLWLFNESVNPAEVSLAQRLKLLILHAQYYAADFTDHKHYDVLKRHIKNYIHDFPGSAELRQTLYAAASIPELIDLVTQYANSAGLTIPENISYN